MCLNLNRVGAKALRMRDQQLGMNGQNLRVAGRLMRPKKK